MMRLGLIRQRFHNVLIASFVVTSCYLIFLYFFKESSHFDYNLLQDVGDEPSSFDVCKDFPQDLLQKNNGVARLGILIAATGKYAGYLKRQIASARRYLLSRYKVTEGHRCAVNVTYYVFTDHPEAVPKGDDVTVIFQRRLGWPYDSMLRNEIYLNSSSVFAKENDVLFSVDADLLFVSHIGTEFLSGDLVGVLHPGYSGENNVERANYPYERRRESCASVREDEGAHYFTGALFGGRTENFLDLCRATMDCVHRDFSHNKLIAIWHDESQLNRYFIDHPVTTVLSSLYYCPEGFSCLGRAKVLALKKNHAKMRERR